MIRKVAVIGAGSLGTAIAQIVSNNAEEVYLYARREKVVDEIMETRVNSEYYPAIKLSDKIKPKYNFDNDFDSGVIFFCVPSSAVRDTAKKIKNGINYKNSIIVSTAKGIEYPSTKTMSQIIFEETGTNPVIFSGPTFASEIMLNLPTVVNIASKNIHDLEVVKELLTTDNFLVDIITDDVIGTEMCSILKNINAVAYGICDGININDNAKYAVLTKGFNETKEIVAKVGGDPKTVNNYCGFGDLALTSTSEKSRNYTLGMLYAKKIIIDEKSSGILFEGKKSILTIKKICDEYNIESLVTNFVYAITIENQSPSQEFQKLWKKLLKE
jgi:glycerol-3-phosphate dehydrogenase (NAD(P)+)